MRQTPSPSKKMRIDHLLVARGLAPSRERAQSLILAGQVLVEEQRVEKSSQTFPAEANIRVKGPDHPYVGRGGVKLEGALKDFQIQPAGKTCLDIGASTGGFTDCLLQNDAQRVYTLDVGTNQLDYRLRQNPKVIARENFNVRYLQASDLPEAIDLIVVDVSFISLKTLLPPIIAALPGPWDLLMLVKPQFEAGPERLARGGVLKDEAEQRKIVQEIAEFALALSLRILDSRPSVLKGEGGNQEYFVWAQKAAPKK